MKILVGGEVFILDTEQVADYALTLRYHFDGVVDAFNKYGPVQIKGPSARDTLAVVQLLNRQLISRALLMKMGIRTYARGSYIVVVNNPAQIAGPLHTLDDSIPNVQNDASKMKH